MGNRLPLLIFAALYGALGCTSTPPEAPASGAASTIPPAPLATLDGASTDLPDYLHGRTALVSFWATWCDACVKEMGALNRVSSEARSRPDALVVGVAVGDTREAVRAFAANHPFAYAQLVDEHFALADALGERNVPATLVVDRHGHVVFRGGALDRDGLAAFRDAL